MKHRSPKSAIRPSVTFLGPGTFLCLERNCIGSKWRVLLRILSWRDSAGCWACWNCVPGFSFLNNSEFSLAWRLARNTLPLNDWTFRACLADITDRPRCGSVLEETALNVFYYCERVRPFWSHIGEWTARVSPKQLVLLDVSYVVDNVVAPYQGQKHVVFLVILAVAWMVIWETRKKELYDGANFSHRDLILFFRHQLMVNIRCDRKRLDHIIFD